MPAIKLNELKRLYECEGAEYTCDHLQEALVEGHLKPTDFSIRDLFEALVEGGREILYRMSFRRSGGMRLREASNAVDTAMFSNITGQIFYNMMLQGYNTPGFLHPFLCETVKTDQLNGEMIAGMGGIGDKAEIVKEGENFPFVGLSEQFLRTARLYKRGFILPITREALIMDRTGLLLMYAKDGGKYMGINKEKRVLDVGFGIVNNYNRNDVATNTYLTAGAYVNQQVNVLKDWTSIEASELLFEALEDPADGEPIMLPPKLQLVVPTALRRTANFVKTSTRVTKVDNQANATTYRTEGNSPVETDFDVYSSVYVKRRTGEAGTWFVGDFPGAIKYMEAWGAEFSEASPNSEAEFNRDIVMQFKSSEMGGAQMYEPRRLQKNTAA